MKILWLLSAEKDIISIIEYHENLASSDAGHRVVQNVVHSALLLIDYSHLGHLSASVDGVYELHVPQLPYLLAYRIINDRIEILRVFHESQDRPSAWQI